MLHKTLLFSLLFLGCTSYDFAQHKVSYKKSDGLPDITPYVAYRADSSEKLTFEQVRKMPYSAFIPNGKVGINLGNTNIPYWFRVDFADSVAVEDLYISILQGEIQMVDAYSVNQQGKVKNWKTGVMRPFSSHFFRSNLMVFDLGKNPETFYLRVKSNDIFLPLALSSIQPYVNYSYRFSFLMGGLIGLILALAAYNFLLFFSLLDRTFLYYSLHALCVSYIVLREQGFNHMLFWQDNPAANSNVNTSSFITIFFAILFITKFLNTRALAPKVHWLLVLLCIAGGLMLPLEWLSGNNRVLVDRVSQLLIILINFSFLFTGFYIAWLGYQPAKYFILAWFSWSLGIIIGLLGVIGILPLQSFLVQHFWEIGAALEIILMAFAVSYRFNLFRKEAREAQTLVLQRSEENEKLLAEHNRILEEKLQMEQKQAIPASTHAIDVLLEKLQTERGKNKKLAVSTLEGVLLLPIPDIIRLEGLGSYCTIYLTQNKKIIASKPLVEFEPMLDKADFLRVHKSHIININFVERYVRGEGGMVVMADGAEVSVSRAMKSELLSHLNIS
ncbi:7TM diverse intracellular signaling domain-containing protein [Runella sp.]|uniref:7TM diverse intracellular signaling domain-containing protein n=1 Tax=Runella sp. TaxID=1960881 RepID=UPI003D0E7BC9